MPHLAGLDRDLPGRRDELAFGAALRRVADNRQPWLWLVMAPGAAAAAPGAF